MAENTSPRRRRKGDPFLRLDVRDIAYPFEDERWRGKLLIGLGLSLLSLIILPLGVLLAGYGLRIMHGAMQTGKPRLARWDAWFGMAVDGARLTVVILAYMLPYFIVLFGSMALFAGGMFSITQAEVYDPRALLASGTGLGSFLLIILLTSPLSVLISFLAPLAALRLLETGSIWKAMQFWHLFGMLGRGWRGYVPAFLVYQAVILLNSFLVPLMAATVLLSFLIPVWTGITAWYNLLLIFGLYGAAYHDAQAQAGTDASAQGSLPSAAADEALPAPAEADLPSVEVVEMPTFKIKEPLE